MRQVVWHTKLPMHSCYPHLLIQHGDAARGMTRSEKDVDVTAAVWQLPWTCACQLDLAGAAMDRAFVKLSSIVAQYAVMCAWSNTQTINATTHSVPCRRLTSDCTARHKDPSEAGHCLIPEGINC